ncbi:MAG TPA: glycosyltransferase family 1 protein [Anaerolineae bacterium]|nr:glycosyltransferase family 1 protein [Anaerolineae bacterium]HOQ98152.1 glycosyltransferase family 1 protein [Anaerolineae bacterium]HPL29487.1 glycosyltransferase family 1 protein [Anaerolineae bacterium]
MQVGIDARLAYYHQAGTARYCLQLLHALSRIDDEDQFVVFQSRRDQRELVTRPNFHIRHMWTPSHHRLEQYLLSLELRFTPLDVLHSPDFIPPFRRHCRSIITIHDLAFLLYPQFLTKSSARYYGQIDQAVRRTDHIIAVSESTRRDIVRLLGVPEQMISVVYEAPRRHFQRLPEAPRPQLQKRFGLERDYVLFVGTIEPRKNIPTLLSAFQQVLDHYHPEVDLVLAGAPGWLTDEVYGLVNRLGLTGRVHFLGRVSDDELIWLYNSAQVLVLPSFYEGFGLPPLEAMACGCPVIVSNVSSLPEVVGDAGLLVDPLDADELTVAIWRVLSDSTLRQELVAKGLKRVTCFSWQRAARETLELYRRVAGS